MCLTGRPGCRRPGRDRTGQAVPRRRLRRDITPKSSRSRSTAACKTARRKCVHDRLHARCLVLDDGTTRLAIVVCDSCMIPREISTRPRRWPRKPTGIPPQRILISATHTHTAPTLGSVFQSEPDEDYVRSSSPMIAAAHREGDRTSRRRESAGGSARTRRRSSIAAGR